MKRLLALALLFAAVPAPPARAGVCFAKLEVDRKTNENTRHQSVLNELEFERKQSDTKLKRALKTCNGDLACMSKQRLAHAKDESAIDASEAHENAAHKEKLARIAADFAAEEKANPKQSKTNQPDCE